MNTHYLQIGEETKIYFESSRAVPKMIQDSGLWLIETVNGNMVVETSLPISIGVLLV